jgi:hypothetical protein
MKYFRCISDNTGKEMFELLVEKQRGNLRRRGSREEEHKEMNVRGIGFVDER